MTILILERVKGIEPSSSAWKAVALPLSYTRIFCHLQAYHVAPRYETSTELGDGGGGWIRTSVHISDQIYSLAPLTTRPPLHRQAKGIIRDKANVVLPFNAAASVYENYHCFCQHVICRLAFFPLARFTLSMIEPVIGRAEELDEKATRWSGPF